MFSQHEQKKRFIFQVLVAFTKKVQVTSNWNIFPHKSFSITSWEHLSAVLDSAITRNAGDTHCLSFSILENSTAERESPEIQSEKNENTKIPITVDYENVTGLSNEVKQKLSEARPQSLARASRLPGVTPAAISLLMVHLKKERKRKASWRKRPKPNNTQSWSGPGTKPTILFREAKLKTWAIT